MNLVEQIGAIVGAVLVSAWLIITVIHTLSFPISEEKMREIIREEVKKILVEVEQP